jgi:hypothetical protein
MDHRDPDTPAARADATDLAAILSRLGVAVERAVEVLDTRIAPALERIAARDEGPGIDRRGEALAAVRSALAGARWDEAHARLEAFAREYRSDPELESLRDAPERGRTGVVTALHDRLEESRQAGDPDAVLGARDELARHLGGPELEDVDRDVRGWLLELIQQRMRSGTVGLDVALWAGSAVDRYGETREGASLRAALPILRRCAGLCARCGAPYNGLEAACPRCLAAAQAGGAGAVADLPPHDEAPAASGDEAPADIGPA